VAASGVGEAQHAGEVLRLHGGNGDESRFAMSDPLQVAESLDRIEALAKERLPHLAYEYIASGAADEITVRRNREALQELRLRAPYLPAAPPIDLSVELLGRRLPHPVLIAPSAYHRLVHPEGEIATAHGA